MFSCDLPPQNRMLSDELPYVIGLPGQRTIIEIGSVKIGDNRKAVTAGPCTLESYEHTIYLARKLKSLGVSVFRGSAFKSRTSPYSFQGYGIQALEWQRAVREECGIPVETEVTDLRQIDTICDYVDAIRVGSRNMHNTPLLKELGKINKPIILKRGFGSTIKEWLSAAEYIMTSGNKKVILCERGIRTFETSTRFSLDFCGLARVLEMTHLPVMIDPSHAAGDRNLVLPLSKAALALGAHGLLIEVHDQPEEALCDGSQAITSKDFGLLMAALDHHNLY